MHVTVIHRYFWPDTPPYASLLRAIAARWTADGLEVDVVTAPPSYTSTSGAPTRPRREEVDGIQVERLPVVQGGRMAQLLNMAGFPLAVGWRLLRGYRSEVVMCSTAPQVTLGWVVSWVCRWRGSRFVYHCMDLHPEIGRLSGEFANPVVYRLLARMDLATMRRAWRIVVLSDDMRQSVLARDRGLGDKTVVLNNFALPDFDAVGGSPLPPPSPDVLRVVFAGNLGRFQSLDTVVDAMQRLDAATRVELVFMGDGKAKQSIRNAADRLDRPGVDVRLVPHQSSSAAKALMRSAHVGLVTLVPGVVRFAYPSKTATYCSQALPLLVMCEEDSELAATVRREELGWAVSSGDLDSLAAAINAAHGELVSGELGRRGDAVAAYADATFAPDAVLRRWSALLSEAQSEKAAA